MFERRLKIFLSILLVLTLVLVVRAFQLQVVSRNYWRERAEDYLRRPQLLETTRGRILDFRDRELAVDVASIDACVDYRAIPREPDAVWVRELAIQSVLSRLGDEYRQAEKARRIEMLAAETDRVKQRIEAMWQTLAARMALSTGMTRTQCAEEIDEIRQQIINRIEVRRRFLWYRRYELALQRVQAADPGSWYKQWLIDESSRSPEIDDFEEPLAEETAAHPILRGIDAETNNFLGKNLGDLPGLSLEPSTHRHYPYIEDDPDNPRGHAAAHLLGHLSRVSGDDLKSDPAAGDELRKYYPNDLIGRTGIEALCEPALRGTRGRIETVRGRDAVVSRQDAAGGKDVRITIDIDLQQKIFNRFKTVRTKLPDETEDIREMHGAAVVIDVQTGQVRALVSYPSFDINKLDDLYAQLLADEINDPLRNRATMSQLVPGSTIKPAVGIGAVTQGVVGVNDGIECTGYLKLGNVTYWDYARCWTASKFGNIPSHAHHGIPWDDPHSTGFLNLTDAIQRSCNVYFETLGDRLGLSGLTRWYDHFGLGRATGLGITEARGTLPDDYRGDNPRGAAWRSAIGQDPVRATPIQMANVAATIARDGIWMRPRLVVDAATMDPGQIPQIDGEPMPDEVDLHLSPAALSAVREGMYRVVNTRAGTGIHLLDEFDEHGKKKRLESTELFGKIAAKTGTAQASKFSIKARNAAGEPVLDENGKPVYITYEPNAFEWYIGSGPEGKELGHAWFMGFAPARGKPQIAFAVLVEYGGSGGGVAATIARGVIEACIEHGYLSF